MYIKGRITQSGWGDTYSISVRKPKETRQVMRLKLWMRYNIKLDIEGKSFGIMVWNKLGSIR